MHRDRPHHAGNDESHPCDRPVARRPRDGHRQGSNHDPGQQHAVPHPDRRPKADPGPKGRLVDTRDLLRPAVGILRVALDPADQLPETQGSQVRVSGVDRGLDASQRLAELLLSWTSLHGCGFLRP